MPKDSAPALVQQQPPLRVAPEFAQAMKAGFILRGSVDRGRAEIEDALRIQEMLESGEYKKMVDAAKSSALGGRFQSIAESDEPRAVFFKLVGMSEDTHTRIMKALPRLGAETARPLRAIGVSWQDIRLLGDGPEELRGEVRALVASGEATKEVVNALVSRLLDSEQARSKAQAAAKDAEARAAEADDKRKRAAAKVIEKDEENKKLKAELSQARQGYKTADDSEIADRFERMQNKLAEAFEQISDVDYDNPIAMSHAEQVWGVLRGQVQSVRASYIEKLGEA